MSKFGKKSAAADDEVEQLLRAAQDDVLLKLNVNSHMARGSASAAIDPDLDRRFKALKKPQIKPAKADGSTKRVTDAVDDKISGAAPGDDLFARFAALKTSIPSHNRNEDKSSSSVNEQETEYESGDEVDKVIRWAIDAARLDPSPPSEDEEEDDDDNTDESDGESGKKKGKRK